MAPADERAHGETFVLDFEPTYTELLTCLEMGSETRKMPEQLY